MITYTNKPVVTQEVSYWGFNPKGSEEWELVCINAAVKPPIATPMVSFQPRKHEGIPLNQWALEYGQGTWTELRHPESKMIHQLVQIVMNAASGGAIFFKDKDQAQGQEDGHLLIEAAGILAEIEEAVARYHDALNNRQHGVMAANELADAVQAAMNMPWKPKRKKKEEA